VARTVRRQAALRPQVGVEPDEFLLELQNDRGIANGGGDTEPIADDSEINHQALQLLLSVGRDQLDLNAVKGLAVAGALPLPQKR
jgi:hypothetical protein